MSNILVRDLSPQLEELIREYARSKGVTLSQAAVELVQIGLETEAANETKPEGIRASDYLSETLKEVLHTRAEAEEFIRSHEPATEKSRATGMGEA